MSANFCNWGDARQFMGECFHVAGMGEAEQRRLIEVAQRLESPLELVMLSAIRAAEKYLDYLPSAGADMLRGLLATRCGHFDLRAAVPVGTYRADLVMRLAPGEGSSPVPPVVIECDGFNYHDRTRDQACRDRARDRYMQREGFIVARFAGDEIVEQPFNCAFEAYDLVLRGIARTQRDIQPEQGWPVFVRGRDAEILTGPPTVAEFELELPTMGPQP